MRIEWEKIKKATVKMNLRKLGPPSFSLIHRQSSATITQRLTRPENERRPQRSHSRGTMFKARVMTKMV
jgi:hypothetical protein